MEERSVSPLSEEQRGWVLEQVDMGMDIMARYGVDTAKSVYENLDDVYLAWLHDDTTDSPEPEAVVFGLGIVFGDRLVHDLGAEWAHVVDSEGEDLAVVIDGRELYPLDFVAKRLPEEGDEEAEVGFFAGMREAIERDFPPAGSA